MTKLGKLWTGAVAYVSLGVGAGLSVAGNLADTYRTRGAATDTLDKFLAACWPLLVLLAIEMFVSPRWSAKRLFQVWRWTGCLSVGGMAMVVSWVHLHDLLASRGQLDIVAILGPLAIDGMAIMATGLILSTRTRGHVDMDTHVHEMSTPATPLDMANAAWTLDMANAVWTPDMANPSRVREVATGMATEPGAPWPEDMSKLMSWAGGHEKAMDMVTAGVGDEIERDLKAITEPLPRRTPPTVAGPPSGGIPVQARELLWAWDPRLVTSGEVNALLAAHFGVSTRTVRRWRSAVLGSASGPPAGGE